MIETIKIKAGSILTWKKYPWFCFLLEGKSKLIPNRAWIATEDTTLLLRLRELKGLKIYEPKKPLSKSECEHLREEINTYLMFHETYNSDSIDYAEIVQLFNNVRPETIIYCGDLSQLNWHGYFKVIYDDN